MIDWLHRLNCPAAEPDGKERQMNWFQIAVAALLALVILILTLQNFEGVTFAFLNFRMTLPLALFIPIIYIMGAITGGSLWSLIRWTTSGVSHASRPH
jgi:lipopolysaccharide assembly protein A